MVNVTDTTEKLAAEVGGASKWKFMAYGPEGLFHAVAGDPTG